MNWVTRERPRVDRIACPWLIKRFVDPQTEFLFAPREQVLAVAEREGATPQRRTTHLMLSSDTMAMSVRLTRSSANTGSSRTIRRWLDSR